MKTLVRSILLLGLLAGLAACARPTERTAAAAGATPGQDDAGALPAIMQLAVGTLELDDGDLAVDGEQAAALLPLWKAYRALNASDTAVQLELEALVAQIRETMSPEQAQAIVAMQLTMEDVAAMTQELGIGAMGSARGAERAGQASVGASGRQGAFAGGGFPAGGAEGRFPGGMGDIPPGAPGMVPGGQASGASPGVARAGGVRAATLNPLIDALIALLESKG